MRIPSTWFSFPEAPPSHLRIPASWQGRCIRFMFSGEKDIGLGLWSIDVNLIDVFAVRASLVGNGTLYYE